MMDGNELSIGRNVSLADSASVTDYGDAVRCDFKWADGGNVWYIFDTKAEAIAHMHRLGWA